MFVFWLVLRLKLNAGRHVAVLEDHLPQKKTLEASAGGQLRDKSVERSSRATVSQRSHSRRDSVDDREYVTRYPSSPPIPAVRHRLDTDRSDVQSRRTARTSGALFLQHIE